MSRKVVIGYRIFHKTRNQFFKNGQIYGSPEAAYREWAWRFATGPGKTAQVNYWEDNFEMQEVRITTTTTVVKNVYMRTNSQRKMDEGIAKLLKE